MTNPLDDALRQHDLKAASLLSQAAATDALDQVALQKFQDLVSDFVRRMQRAGNPGTNWDRKQGPFRKVRGWSLTYESGDAWRRVPVQVDGLVPDFSSPSAKDYVQPKYSNLVLTEKQLQTLALSMAEVLRDNSVV